MSKKRTLVQQVIYNQIVLEEILKVYKTLGNKQQGGKTK